MKKFRFPKLGFNLTTLLLAIGVIGFLLFPHHALYAMVPVGAGMILDAQLLLSDAQALSATGVSTNIIDLGSDRDIGFGEPLAILITLDVAADRTTGDETYAVTVQADDNTGFASPAVVVGPVSLLRYTVGSKFVIPIPPDTTTERYLRLSYTLGGTTPSVTLTAALMPLKMISVSENQFYPDAINVG